MTTEMKVSHLPLTECRLQTLPPPIRRLLSQNSSSRSIAIGAVQRQPTAILPVMAMNEMTKACSELPLRVFQSCFSVDDDARVSLMCNFDCASKRRLCHYKITSSLNPLFFYFPDRDKYSGEYSGEGTWRLCYFSPSAAVILCAFKNFGTESCLPWVMGLDRLTHCLPEISFFFFCCCCLSLFSSCSR